MQLVRTSPCPPAAWPWLAYYAALATLRAPITLAETAWLAARRGPVPPPVFVVGHWRSGTTHLHNLLAQAPRFACLTPVGVGLPAERLLLGRPLEPWLQRLAPADRGVDAVRVDRTSPQEDEIPLASLGAPSCYHAYYLPNDFARRFEAALRLEPGATERWARLTRALYARLALERPSLSPLIKNPVYTARMATLAERFPGAQFVHCARAPEEVFASSVTYHAAMLDKLSLHRPPSVDLETFVLDLYATVMAAYAADAPRLAPGALVEVRYEELTRDPLAVLAQIYDGLRLDGFAADRPCFERYLDTVEGYRARTYALDAATRRRIRERWRRYYEPLGYRLDEAAVPG